MSSDDAVHLEVDDGVPVEAELVGEDRVAVLVEVGRVRVGDAAPSNCTGVATSEKRTPSVDSSSCR